MKPNFLRLTLAAGIFLGLAPTRADVINDGTSTANLVRLANSNGTDGAVTTLTPGGGGLLSAAQTGASSFSLALRTVWFAGNSTATSGVYSVSADFQPTANFGEYVGGVMGWLNPASRRGISLLVVPGESFQVRAIDFSATTSGANEGVSGLFNSDGTAATADTTSAGSPLTGYDASLPATFELAFTAPGAADLTALPTATARLTARVLQAPSGGGAAVLVGRAMELLTDIAKPPDTGHRFGYFGYYGLAGFDGDVIGSFDNLTATNVSTSTEPSEPPRLTITLTGGSVEVSWPIEYTSYQLQSSPTVGPASWTTLTTQNNRYATGATGTAQFFRLTR